MNAGSKTEDHLHLVVSLTLTVRTKKFNSTWRLSFSFRTGNFSKYLTESKEAFNALVISTTATTPRLRPQN